MSETKLFCFSLFQKSTCSQFKELVLRDVLFAFIFYQPSFLVSISNTIFTEITKRTPSKLHVIRFGLVGKSGFMEVKFIHIKFSAIV